MTTSHLDTDASDDDDDHSSQASSSSSSSELEYIDPSLQPSRSMTSHPGLNLRSPPSDFATNTGHFRSLPLSASNSTPAFNHHSQEENEEPSSKFSASDYTHISQAIAHQPLAINPSQQTVDLMKKLAQASLGREQGSDIDRVAHFMAEVTAQVCSRSAPLLLQIQLSFHSFADVQRFTKDRCPRNRSFCLPFLYCNASNFPRQSGSPTSTIRLSSYSFHLCPSSSTHSSSSRPSSRSIEFGRFTIRRWLTPWLEPFYFFQQSYIRRGQSCECGTIPSHALQSIRSHQ